MGDEFYHFWIARPRFACHLDRGGVLLQTATGVTQPRPMDTGAAVELPTAAANFCMLLTIIATTNGAWLDADRANGGVDRVSNVTLGKVLLTELMFAARLHRQMIAAKRGVAEVTLRHTLLAAFLAALGTDNGVGGEFATAGTIFETFQAKGFAAAVELIEAGANPPPTFATSDQAVGTKALAGGGTDAKLRAVLLATWATNGTISTYERM